MAIITPSDTLKTTTANAWLAAIDAGASNSSIKFYTGSKPASPSVAPNGTTQVLLGTCTCSTVAGVVASQALTFNAVTQDASADTTGTATWARVCDGDGTGVIDVDVSDLGGTAFLKMNTTSIVAGGPISVASFVINF